MQCQKTILIYSVKIYTAKLLIVSEEIPEIEKNIHFTFIYNFCKNF